MISNQKSRLHILRDMIIFVEVGRRRNFTLAAAALGIPLSTLARRISVLEGQLGIPLIERSTRHNRLTADGQIYFDRCQHIVDEALTAYEGIYEQVHGVEGLISIAIAPELSGEFFSKLFFDFLKQHTGLNMHVGIADASTDPGDLTDLVIRVGEPSQGGFVTRKVASLPLGLYAASKYLRSFDQVTSLADLKNHEILISKSCEPYCGVYLSNLPEGKINMSGRLVGDDVSCLIASLAILEGGIAVVPINVARPYVAAGQLERVLPSWIPGFLPVFVLMASKRLPARLRTFLNFLTDRLESEAIALATGPSMEPTDPEAHSVGVS